MTEFTRQRDLARFAFGGIKINVPADALPEYKYALALNVRGYQDSAIQTRPGQSLKFTNPNADSDIVSMRAYTGFQTDDLPRILAVDDGGRVILDNGVQVGSLGGMNAGAGAAMVPFRPAESPNPYMYIANSYAYNKYSAPTATDLVTEENTGIAEPATACEASLLTYYEAYTNSGAAWTNAGTAGTVTAGTRLSDTVGAVLPDPAYPSVLYSVEVGSGVSYQRYMEVKISAELLLVLDVFPPLLNALTINAIYYFSGTTGHCVIVPAGPQAGSDADLTQGDILGALRRGALIKVGAEICYVWSVTIGPDGTVCIETSTTNAHTTADTITGVPAIQCEAVGGLSGATIAPVDVTYQVTAGIGTQTATLAANPFVSAGFGFGSQDYMSIPIMVDNLANLIEVKLLIDVGDGSFSENFYYYTIRASDIQEAVANTSTQISAAQLVLQRAVVDAEIAASSGQSLLTTSGAQTPPGSSQWAQILIPISALTRVGSDQTKTLQNAGKIQFLWNASGTINVATADVCIFGGIAPDVGDAGAPYKYRVRPRSKVTGAKGNPSPEMRYGVSPRRTMVLVSLPSAAYDSQIDTWDIFRFGGSVNSWRFIGQVPSATTTFSDTISDSAAAAGEGLEFDNFEPWPSIDLPFNETASQVVGTIAVVSLANAGNVLNYLPGNIIQLSDGNAYTLRNRPTLISGTDYLFEFLECANFGINVDLQIYEPEFAKQTAPYMWGPDSGGTVFACGDPYRPGTLYFAKNYAPDSAPDNYNIEITPPSEPLLGGEILDGLSYVASPERWWALYPTPQDPSQRYNVVQLPVPRGLIAPFGHCNDGQQFYWWAKDGIWGSREGSLTDADLYTLFPHEGIEGDNYTYMGKTVYAPDYSSASSFRLTYSNYYLYATYLGTDGTFHTLVYDVKRKAWSLDDYTPEVRTTYHVEQQSGTLNSEGTLYDVLLMGNINGQVAVQKENTNDIGGAIACVVSTREFNGGDERAPKQWGDMFIDCVPAGYSTGLVVTPVSFGTGLVAPTTIATYGLRTRSPISTKGVAVSDFLGMNLAWTDNFPSQAIPTILNIWQLSWVIQPANLIALYTLGSSFGLKGYIHLRQIAVAYISTAAVTMTITAYDGTSPSVITLPSTAGNYRKTLFPISFNKGLLYSFSFTCANKFQIFLDDTELYVGEWGRGAQYAVARGLGGQLVDKALV